MEENKEGSAEKFFRDFGKKMDQFAQELKEAGSRAEVDLQKKYEEVKATAQKLKAEAENKERWKEVETSLKKAGEELENAFKAAFKKKNNS
ncbi:MAG: hypothetical protein OJF59_000351 [Cytophagales bacterium]|jgi:phosphoglycerate-specific signal transduction histidine kinase|nr:hypothetical protein [Bacteroidota bacterium]MBS1981164.1 hypothetical protein [Bacteroidota bacterium]WHZ06598.1 MAG: hypothetical protein OJF59_000351 [Cytophagales bacterium]